MKLSIAVFAGAAKALALAAAVSGATGAAGARGPAWDIKLHADGKTYGMPGQGGTGAMKVSWEKESPGYVCAELRKDGVSAFTEVLSCAGHPWQGAFDMPATLATMKVSGAKDWSLECGAVPADGGKALENRGPVAGLAAKTVEAETYASGITNRLWILGPARTADGKARYLVATETTGKLRFADTDFIPFWRHGGATAETALAEAVAESGKTESMAKARAAELEIDIARICGEEGIRRAGREMTAYWDRSGRVVAADANGQPLCMETCDCRFLPIAASRIWEDAPQMLFFSPCLMRAALAPVLLYASSGKRTGGLAPEKAGRSDRESCYASAAMIVPLAGLAHIEGDAGFAASWAPLVDKWAAGIAKCVESGKCRNPDMAALALACHAKLAPALGCGPVTAAEHAALAAKTVAHPPGGRRLGELAVCMAWDDALQLGLYGAEIRKTAAEAFRETGTETPVFLSMLRDQAAWRKYASREKRSTRLYAPLRAAPGSLPPAKPFTIASFNIRVAADGGDNEWSLRLPRIAATARKRRFDIFGVQEALPEQRAGLDAALPGWARVGEGRDGNDAGEAMCIYYSTNRFECLDSGTFWLSETPHAPASRSWGSACRRTCTWGLFRDRATGRKFRFYNTHLDHISHQARANGMDTILKEMMRMSQGETVFLAGDMNDSFASLPPAEREELRKCNGPQLSGGARPSHPISAAMQTLYDTYRRTETPHEGPAETFHGYKPRNIARIDYIFASGDVRVLKHATCDDRPGGKFPSDHDAVCAEVLIP